MLVLEIIGDCAGDLICVSCDDIWFLVDISPYWLLGTSVNYFVGVACEFARNRLKLVSLEGVLLSV